MPKFTITIFLALISISSFAQKASHSLDKSVTKKLPNLKYIPSKTFKSLVHTGKDSAADYSPRMSSVTGFYISQTEVTNKEFREFVHYVRDSIAHSLLGHFINGNNTVD